MKRVPSHLLVVFFLLLGFSVRTSAQAPVISALSPLQGSVNSPLTITGSGFGATQGNSKAIIGGLTASITSWNSGSIVAVVPSSAPIGSVNVQVLVSNVFSNAVAFTVLPTPVITTLSINAGPVGAVITINGTNFGASQSTSTVTFNSIQAIPNSWSDTAISVTVPEGATTGNIVVTVNGVQCDQPVAFMVVPPTPTGIGFVQGNYFAVQSSTLPSTLQTVTIPYPVAQTQHDLNVIVIGWRDTKYQVQSVTDTTGNTYSIAAPVVSLSGFGRQVIYYSPNISGAAANSVTVTFTGAAHLPDIRISEYKGIVTTNPLDVTAGKSATSGTLTDSGFATTTNANDVLIGANLVDTSINTTAAGANYTAEVLTTPRYDIFEDRIVTATGSYDASAPVSKSGDWIAQMAAFKASSNQAPVVNAGPNQTIKLPTNTATLNGTVTDDGLPNNTLTISWSQVSGPTGVTFSTPSAAVTQATFPGVGTYVLQLSANDSQLTSSATTTVIVIPAGTYTLTLSPPVAGPNVVGTSQALTAVLSTTTGATTTVVPGAIVQFTVTGPNATSGTATTDATGTAKFTYSGTHSGTDTIQASYAVAAANSNAATVSWLIPSQPVSTGTVFARFFNYDSSGSFDATPATPPLFTQFFPTIDFNPPAGTIPGNTSGVGVSTHPWTDVVTDASGNFAGTIVAQGNGFQAGVGSLTNFQVVFTGTLTVPTAGNVTFNFYTDDGFILGIGGGTTRVSGAFANVPASGVTPFTNLPIVGAYNVVTPPVGNTVTVNFPAAGTYNYELDFFECCGPPVVLTMATGQSNTGVPPTGSLILSPITPASLAAGQSQVFTVLATNASGAAAQNVQVDVAVFGANQLNLSAVTDATGHATFQYAGTNAGTDSIQVSAIVSGLGAYSNTANMTWTVVSGGGGGTGGGGTEVFTPQGVIGSPVNGAVVQTQIPITLAPGLNLTSGTLTYWPLSNPSAVTTLNSNTTGSGTIGTFDATLLPNGGYAIELNATANGTPQISYVTVTVVGDNKPGRITSTVTDFKVPLAGIPISITRTYDSLEKSQGEDFGFGWKLGTTVGLNVDLKGNVTFNFNGQRETFYLQPQPQNIFFAWILYAQYVPQPGLHGTLTSDGCSPVWSLNGSFNCLLSTTPYQPTTYVYTDPSGRVYTISANGQLQSIKDLNGNTLTIAANGITSSVNGVVVPFVRDGAGRITKITDTNGKNYIYSYDQNGNLQSVQYPALTTAETYTYFSDHSLHTQTDPRGNSSTATYYADGRLQTFTDQMQNAWSYSYNLATNTKTTTNPDGGVVTETDDNFGKPLSVTDPLNRTTTYVYDGNENVFSMTDPLHKTTTYTYDSNGFQTSVTDPLLNKSTKTYNQFGGVLTSTDAANTNTQITTYDANFNPLQVTDLLNGPKTFVSSATFDQSGNISTFTDANHSTTQFFYDPNGNLNVIIDPLNATTRYVYDAMGRVMKHTDPNQNVTQFFYDDLGRLKTRIDALQNQTSYAYDDNGNKTSETDGNHHATTYQYDALNRVSAILYPDNTSKSFTYDFRGNKLTEVDQLGRTIKYVYDLAGQSASVTYAYGTSDAGTMSYTYDADGRQKTVTDELNHTTTNSYDAAGRLNGVQDALNNLTSYGYDADNRKISVTDANQHTTSYAYDPRGRLTTTTYPIVPPATTATSSLATYDGLGRLLSATDQAGNPTVRGYDLVGRLTSVMDALHNVTRYGYDPAGNLVSVQDALQRVTTYQYDPLNRRSKKILPIQQIFETYTYDGVGNLATKTDFNGKKTTYSYDPVNRLLSKTPDPSLSQPTVSFTYTATGQRASVNDASGPTSYTYDNRDRVLTKVTPEGTLSYTYDAHGKVLTIASSNADGASMSYAYDAVNRLSSVTDNRLVAQGAAAAISTYSYDSVSNLLSYTYPNGVQTTVTFDPLNRLAQINSAKSGTLASYAYAVGPAGNRLSLTELGGRLASYGYDNDYRLTSEAITGDPGGQNGTVNYTYDVVGNRTQMTSTLSGVASGTLGYDANDRLTTDGYDNNGNTISSGGLSYSYDFENRLAGSGGLGIVYDGDGNRVSETAGSAATKFLIDDKNPTGLPQVLDEIVNGSVTRTYAYGLQRISENQLIGGTWTPSFYGYDGHGNARFLTNAAGAVTDTYQYDAFGNQVANTGTTPNGYFYSGERLDPGLGMYDLRARYYRQATGRFWSRDPIEGKLCCDLNWHPYLYTENNPVNAIDPTGLDAEDEYGYLSSNFSRYVREIRTLGSVTSRQRICLTAAVVRAALNGWDTATMAEWYFVCLARQAAPFN
jgi:RHS repeat-associated protein